MDIRKNVLLTIFLIILVLFSSGFTKAENKINGDIISNSDHIEIIEIDEYYNKIYNYGDGYSIKYPKKFVVDDSLGGIKVSLKNENTLIEIYYDDFRDRDETIDIYTNYSNKFIQDNKYIEILTDGYFDMNGLRVNLLRWKRKELKGIPYDKNYYISGEIIKNNKEIYTILIKTQDNNYPYLEIIENFKLIPRSRIPRNTRVFKSKSQSFNDDTMLFYNQYLLENNELKWGIFEPTAPTSMLYLTELETKLGYEFTYLLKYQHLDSKLVVKELENASKKNKYLELTLQTTVYNEDFNPNINYEILEGKYDDFLNEYASYIKSYGEPVLFRLNNEMNGDWCGYNGLYNGKDTEIYKALWKYIYNIFQKNKVDNAIWIWNPNNRDFPNFKWNNYINYYPGEEYVDVIGLTAYNTGNYYEGEKWEDFKSLYDPLYKEYMEIFDYPFIITEFGSNSIGGDKVQWIHDMFEKIESYENIKGAIWFNGTDLDHRGNPARIYRLDENNSIIEKFREMLPKK